MANTATVATTNVYGSTIIASKTVIFSNVGVISSSAGINVAPVNIAIFSNLPTSVNVSSSKQQSYSYGF